MLATVPAVGRQVLTGRVFFPELISGPFHHGLVVVFSVSTALAVIAGVASVLRFCRYVHPEYDRVWQDNEQATPISSSGSSRCPSGLQEESVTTEAPLALDPRRTALLVMDFQMGVFSRISNADPLLARVARAIETVRAQDGQVGYVRLAFEYADYAAIPPTSPFAAIVSSAGRAYDTGSPATKIHDRVAPQPGDIVVRKTRVGAFSTTDLDAQLRDLGVRTLILAGISTSGVVLSTVRDASDRDYQIVVLADGCADPDPEVHDVLFRKVFPRQAHVATVEELPGLFRQHR